MDEQKQAENEGTQQSPDTVSDETVIRQQLRTTIILALAAAAFWILSVYFYADVAYMHDYMRGGYTYNEMGKLLGYPEQEAGAKLYSCAAFIAGAVCFGFYVRAHLRYRKYRIKK